MGEPERIEGPVDDRVVHHLSPSHHSSHRVPPQASQHSGEAEVGFIQRFRWIGLGLLALVAIVIGVVVWRLPGGAVAKTTPEIPLVSVVVPRLEAVTSSVNFTGAIVARNDIAVAAEGEGGRVTGVFVEAGDRVKRGDAMASVDNSIAMPQVATLVASLDEVRASAELAQAEFDRAIRAATAGAFSVEEIERRRAASVTAAAKVKVAESQLEEARARLGRTEIRAPYDGIVLERMVEAGQVAPAGQALFRLAQGAEVEMRGMVAEQDLPLLAANQTASVRITGVSTPFSGKVRLVGAIVNPETRLGTINVTLPADPNLRPGAFARGEVIVGNAERAVVPQTAVLSEGEQTYVLVVGEDNRVARRVVRVEGTNHVGVVVSEGLNGDERVIATAGAFLREGEQIRIADKPAGAA